MCVIVLQWRQVYDDQNSIGISPMAWCWFYATLGVDS